MGLRTIIIFLFVLFRVCGTGYAFWTGPSEEASGSWGNQPGQFAINYQETHDIFPTTIAISSSGQIAISEDQTLKRVQIFKGGTLEKIIDTFAFDMVFSNSDLFVSGGGFRKYDPAGNLIWNKPEISFFALYATFDGNIIGYNRKENKYSLYSPTGQLIKTSAERPLELGVVKTESRGSGNYRITIIYPDKTYVLTSDSYFEKYVRDNRGYVYGLNSGGVWKFNQCGKEIAELIVPTEEKETITAKNAPDQSIDFDVEYGQPIVSANGDVYTWRKSLNKYSIVKWTWVDDPNAPTGPDAPSGLSVAPSINGLYLTWTASPNDLSAVAQAGVTPAQAGPGCVTKYEIARATSAGGVHSTIGTVDKGVIKYNDTSASAGTTYYYKIRAVAGTEYSPYTTEVSGKR